MTNIRVTNIGITCETFPSLENFDTEITLFIMTVKQKRIYARFCWYCWQTWVNRCVVCILYRLNANYEYQKTYQIHEDSTQYTNISILLNKYVRFFRKTEKADFYSIPSLRSLSVTFTAKNCLFGHTYN